MKGTTLKQRVKNALGDLYLLAHPPAAPQPLSLLTRLHVVLGMCCNCRCSMCYQTDFRSLMEPALYDDALRPLFPHLREVILQGGEPTLFPQTRRFADLVLKANPACRFALFTNGQRFDAGWAEFVAGHGSYVNVSINAATEATYRRITSGDVDWTRLLDNVRRLVAARGEKQDRVRVQTSLVVIDDNVGELSAFLEFSRTLGADAVQFYFDPTQLPHDRGRAEQELRRAADWRREYPRVTVEGLEMLSHRLFGTPPVTPRCSWPFDSLYVDVNGDVRFCCLMNKPIGNLRRAGVEELWNNWRARRLREMVRNRQLRFCGHYCRPGKVAP